MCMARSVYQPDDDAGSDLVIAFQQADAKFNELEAYHKSLLEEQPRVERDSPKSQSTYPIDEAGSDPVVEIVQAKAKQKASLQCLTEQGERADRAWKR